MPKVNYKATLQIYERTYEGQGETIYDAITDIGLDYTQIKGKGNLIIKQGKDKCEKLFYLPMLRKLFVNKIFRAIQSRYMKLLLEAAAKNKDGGGKHI